jgi:hypothetical protein
LKLHSSFAYLQVIIYDFYLYITNGLFKVWKNFESSCEKWETLTKVRFLIADKEHQTVPKTKQYQISCRESPVFILSAVIL